MLISQPLKRAVLFVCAMFCAPLAVLCQEPCQPITKDSLMRSFELGRRQRKTAADYVELINRCGVGFSPTGEDEQKIRRLGKYLGKKGLDDLVAAVRNNYRLGTPDTPPDPSSSSDLPLSFLKEVPFKGGSPQRLDAVMKAAGYTGTTAMAVLYVRSNEANEHAIIVGTRPDLNAKNSWVLEYGAEWFEFRGGEDTARVYILSDKDGKIDVTYRPRSVVATQSAAREARLGVLQCLVYDEAKSDDFHIGDGVRGATCIARNQRTKEEYVGTTNSNGLATISVPYGSYTVTIKAPNYLTQVMAAYLEEYFVTVEVRLVKSK